MYHFKKLYYLMLIAALSHSTFAQSDCNDSKPCKPEHEFELKQAEIDIDLSYQENLKLNEEHYKNLDSKIKATTQVEAFTKPYEFRKRDESNSHDRYQYNIDNFFLPVFSCKLPQIDASRKYKRDEISDLDTSIKKYHYCLNKSAEQNRETFKIFIVNKLDGEILPSKGNTILWSTLPEHQVQTQNIMANINLLYKNRYQDYLDSHESLQRIIQTYNLNNE